MSESKDTNSQNNPEKWSDQKTWIMGIVATAIIGLGAAGWKYATNHLPLPRPDVPPKSRIEFVAINDDWEPSTKVSIKGWAVLKGDEVTVRVDQFQVQNSSRTVVSILAIRAVFMRPITPARQYPAGELGPRVAIGKTVAPGTTILLEPFTTKIKLEQGRATGAWLSFQVFTPGDGMLPVHTAPELF